MSRNRSSRAAVPGAFGGGQKPTPPPPTQPPTPAPAAPASPAGIPKLPPTAPSGKTVGPPADTRAGVREYDAFFALYAQSFAPGCEFWPLGFVPGPALVTYGDQPVAATPDVVSSAGGKLPASVASLPQAVRQAMWAWADLFQALGFAPTPWNLGRAKQLLSGRKPDGTLVMGMTRFRYRGSDAESPFGATLVPTNDGMRVEKVYNPNHVSDTPTEGSVLRLAELKDEGSIQKLIRTWALMEANFSRRYHRDGSPRPREDHRDRR